jgi:hypothetical protein
MEKNKLSSERIKRIKMCFWANILQSVKILHILILIRIICLSKYFFWTFLDFVDNDSKVDNKLC